MLMLGTMMTDVMNIAFGSINHLHLFLYGTVIIGLEMSPFSAKLNPVCSGRGNRARPGPRSVLLHRLKGLREEVKSGDAEMAADRERGREAGRERRTWRNAVQRLEMI